MPSYQWFQTAGAELYVTRVPDAGDTPLDVVAPTAPAPVDEWRVELTVPGPMVLTFDQSLSHDLGNYVGEFVQQRNLMNVQGAWVVFFRPDVDGLRNEIVIELGARYNLGTLPPTTRAGIPAHVMEPYTAAIYENDELIETVTVPRHFWGARWRWQSALRPIVRSYAYLVALKAILPMDLTYAINDVPPTAFPTFSPMGTAGLTTYMPTTGDRQEIGYLTDPQACFLLTGDPAALITLMAHGEAAGSIPMFFRDAETDALLDCFKTPYLASLTDGFTGKTHLIPTPPFPADKTIFFTPDAAHFPQLSFLPYMLTDDPYHLENMQAAANWMILQSNYYQDFYKLPGLASPAQTRAFAWGLLLAARLASHSPVNLTPWLLPRSHWQSCMDNNLDFVGRAMASADPRIANFHRLPAGNLNQMIPGFEVDYLMHVIGWMAWCGLFPGWQDAVDWMAGPRLEMIAPPSPAAPSWDRRWPVPYNTSIPVPSPPPPDFAGLWAWWSGAAGMNTSAWQPDTLAVVGLPGFGPSAQLGYCIWARGGLAALAAGGVAGARPAHDWLFAEIQALQTGYHRKSGYKWAVAPVPALTSA